MTRIAPLHLTPLSALLITLFATAPALGQDRTSSERARMELSVDHGVAIGLTNVRPVNRSSSGYTLFGAALSADLRVYSADGVGAVLRTGYEGALSTGLFTVDAGAAYRGDLVSGAHTGLQLVAAGGGSVSYGTLVGSSSGWGLTSSNDLTLAGAWGSVHLELWHRNVFFGVGVTARARWADGYDEALVSLTPALRVGGDWGL